MQQFEFSDISRMLTPIFARHDVDASRLLQVLLEVQDACHFIPSEAIDQIAAHFDVPRVNVEGVAGFYSFLSTRPVGEYRILFSDNITDQMLGKDELMLYLCNKLWVEPGKVSEDGLVSVASTSCTGLCDQGPAALVNGWPLTNLDRNRLDLIAELIRSRKPVADWPPMLFEVADNIRRSDVLLGQPFEPGAAMRATLARGAKETLAEVDKSNLRGRGGAGFKTASKWSFCHAAIVEEEGSMICDVGGHPERYIVCNADEGEPGTFKDRVLLNSYADLVFEGMTVGARVVGASKGFLYLRGEYRYLLKQLESVLQKRREAGLLGDAILGRADFSFDIEIHLGAGAYICGEESALIESLEGRRGRPRNRPPFPVTHGYKGRPTVVDNVETFACVAKIAERGGAWFAAMGTAQSTGTKLLSISGDCATPGIYEYPFGVTVRQILADCGAREPYAVQVSGPSGTLISWKEFDRRIAFEDLPTAGAFMVFQRKRDMFQTARNFVHFFAHESCGFCTPCRVGTELQKKIMDKIASGHGTASDLEEMKSLGHILKTMSHCGLGSSAANPVLDTLEKFPDVYVRKLKALAFEPAFDLDGALETARKMTGRDDDWAHL
ncbi:MAG: NADP oxidoreductase [Hydrogenophilales bacterium CG_4_9_14_3_um_filter_59_35]|nr:MAG: NADP oxidoreductase [Hydrogenophilales bacterium CG18_big_fil_WC_8_21_14_2_50_58_12]PIY00362.1 MAG: NADP oxidoreductase [Hydrogenophilales bacterium CG_4_10_14_3_um_filter_58_23]PJB07884.1 MAG: NADP oxidoreductase [Hydrogenophilales bacterium CG_4_9_14_3_um_filter_59_35]